MEVEDREFCLACVDFGVADFGGDRLLCCEDPGRLMSKPRDVATSSLMTWFSVTRQRTIFVSIRTDWTFKQLTIIRIHQLVYWLLPVHLAKACDESYSL